MHCGKLLGKNYMRPSLSHSELGAARGRNGWATFVREEDMQNSLESFKPKFLNDLVRVGRAFDGGYVVNERSIHISQYLLSLGVNNDWSFEAEFLRRNPSLKVLCFDHSVSKRIFLNKMLDAWNEIFSMGFLFLVLSFNVRGIRQRLSDLKYCTKIYHGLSSFLAQANVSLCSMGVSSEKSRRFVTLVDAFQMISPEALRENSVFIKMDIEQSEFRVLPDLLRFEQYINGMVVEFHDLDILWANFSEVMNELRAHFEITHMHGNNYEGLIPNSRTPKCLEVTFLKKSLIREERPAREDVTYPIPALDRPNDRSVEDYPLVF